MTDDIDRLARERLAADEARITGPRRHNLGLGQVAREFWRHPSPWLIGGFLLASLVGRIVTGGGSWWELLIPGVLVALFPVIEWVIHVGILHWRPRRVGSVEVDSLLARKHREHHADPRDIPLVFIPWPVLAWLLPAYVVLVLLVVPDRTAARLRVDPLPHPLRLPPPLRSVSRRVAQPPTAPLQERALLVHRDQLGHRRSALRHLSGPRESAHLGDRAQPPRHGLTRRGRCCPADGALSAGDVPQTQSVVVTSPCQVERPTARRR
jgi:hypothetical protein